MSRDDNADDKESKKSLLSTIRSLIRRSLIKRFEDDTGQPREVSWSIYQGFAIVVGVIIVTFYAAHGTAPWKSSAIGLLIAGAALAAGVLIGFLFGIPRTQQKEGQKSDPTIGSQPGVADGYGVNTNLEQISDWLTKIIVGVGLVQLTVIP